jgi:anti-anti-sigma regulatory factor
MLRITVLNDAGGATFKMEGKVAHDWVVEAQKAWVTFSNTQHEKRVVVDLCGVSFVDESGKELLARMHLSGAKLIGTGPMMGTLIDDVKRGYEACCVCYSCFRSFS